MPWFFFRINDLSQSESADPSFAELFATVRLSLRSLGLESRATMGIGLNGGAVALDSQRREPLVIAVTRFMKSRSDDIGSANVPPLIPTIFRPH